MHMRKSVPLRCSGQLCCAVSVGRTLYFYLLSAKEHVKA